MNKKNIVLIGMPGAGKSTAGVVLAKIMQMEFVDSDIVIQRREQRSLSQIIEEDGIDGFAKVENDVNKSLDYENTIIATGGSVVYCEEAMEHLREIGTVIYIKLSYDTISARLGNIQQRGVVVKEGQTLKDLYEERCPLYEKYAHIIIDSEDLTVEELVQRMKNEYIK